MENFQYLPENDLPEGIQQTAEDINTTVRLHKKHLKLAKKSGKQGVVLRLTSAAIAAVICREPIQLMMRKEPYAKFEIGQLSFTLTPRGFENIRINGEKI